MNSYVVSFAPALANHLWQSTALAAAAWMLTILLRKNSARVRYGIWLAASIKFLLPFSLLIALGGLLPKPKQVVAPAMYTAMKVTEQPFADIAAIPAASLAQAPTVTDRIAAYMPAALLALWLMGAAAVLIVWWLRWRRASVCLRNAVSADGREVEILRRLEARVCRPRSSLCLRLSSEQTEPSVYGIFRQVLVWPAQLSERLSDEHIEAIMAHELAHARRFDNAAAALHMLVEAVFWFHPMVWWMERRMIEERELACDEAAIALGGKPEAYAEGILETCRFCVGSALPCIAGVTGADLRKRVVNIMAARRLMRMRWPQKMLVGAAALCALAAPVLLGQLQDNSVQAADALNAGQSQRVQQQARGAGSLKFEVAAIKIGTPPEGGAISWISSIPRPGGTYRLVNVALKQWVEMGLNVSDYALKAPAWLADTRFDLNAKAPADGGPFTQKDADEMIRNLLVDRFGMEWHEERETVSGYELVAGKKVLLKASDPRDPKQAGGSGWGPATINGHNMPMSDLATMLGRAMGAPVVDDTHLTGGFEVKLVWRPDDDQAAAALANQMKVNVDDLPSTVFAAVQEQAGLKLERAQVQSRVIVVDNISRQPSDN